MANVESVVTRPGACRAAAEYIDFAPAFAHYGEIFRCRLIEQERGT